MNVNELLLKNKIIEVISGSHLYGTNRPDSDKDYVGIFLPSVEYILGFKKIEEIDCSIKDKTDTNKNSSEAVDRKFYDFRKFISLALDNNPNIIELLFVNSSNIVYINEVGQDLLNIKSLFLHKGLKQKFLGYAFAQKHKMIIKKDNYFNLIQAYDYLNKENKDQFLLEVCLKQKPPFISFGHNETHNVKTIIIGDLQLQPSKTIRDTLKILDYRISAVGNREELLLKYGYDTKFAMHLIRLMLEGIELLTTGNLIFPLKEVSLLKDIREGKWEIPKILKFSEDLESQLIDYEKISCLANAPRRDEIEKFTIKHLRNIVNHE